MSDAQLFTRLGYQPAAAAAALEWAGGQLAGRGLGRARYYIFRSGGASGGAGGAASRPRLLVAFPSADAALGFAQRQRLGAAPRLLALSLAQILAVLAQRPAIGAALFADEATPAASALPSGLRIERAALISQLDGTAGAPSAAEEGGKLV